MYLIPVPGWASPGSYLIWAAGVTPPLRSVTVRHHFYSPCCTHCIFLFFQTRAEGFTCIQTDGLLDHSLCPRAACDSNRDRCPEGDPDSRRVPCPAHLQVLDLQPCATYNCVCTGRGHSLTPLGKKQRCGQVWEGVHKLANSQISVYRTQRSPVHRSRPG